MQNEFFNIDKIIKLLFKDQTNNDLPVNDMVLAIKKQINEPLLKAISDEVLQDIFIKIKNEIKNRNLLTEKSTEDSIDGIIKFQKNRLLDKQSFVFKVEVLHVLEELLEMLGYESLYAREIAKKIFNKYFADKEPVEDEKLVDCFFDICTYSVGSIMKLKYDPKCVFKEGSKEINSRIGPIVDGKFIKDKSPEARAKWYRANYLRCSK